MSKRISTILDEGIDRKVFVKWTSKEDNDFIEYSIHTKGINHTNDDHDLNCGMYFYGDEYERWHHYFEAMYKPDSNAYQFREAIEKTVDSFVYDDSCWIEHDYRLEFLSICNGNEDEVYSFQGDGYRYLEDDYNKSCVKDYISFEDYIIYTSQDW